METLTGLKAIILITAFNNSVVVEELFSIGIKHGFI